MKKNIIHSGLVLAASVISTTECVRPIRTAAVFTAGILTKKIYDENPTIQDVIKRSYIVAKLLVLYKLKEFEQLAERIQQEYPKKNKSNAQSATINSSATSQDNN